MLRVFSFLEGIDRLPAPFRNLPVLAKSGALVQLGCIGGGKQWQASSAIIGHPEHQPLPFAGFDGEDFPTLRGEPVGVAAAAGADVAGETRLSVFEESWRPGAVYGCRVIVVVLLEQRVPVLVTNYALTKFFLIQTVS